MSKALRISDEFIESVCKRLSSGKRIRRNLPGWGKIHIDKRLPFLCIYRNAPGSKDVITPRLISHTASFIIVSGSKVVNKSLTKLIYRIAETLNAEFKAFLILEIWAGGEFPDKVYSAEEMNEYVSPAFRIFSNVQKKTQISGILKDLKERLSSVKILKHSAKVDYVYSQKAGHPNLPSLLTEKEAAKLNCYSIGLEVKPVYINPATGKGFPVVRRKLREQLTYILQHSFFEFTNELTSHDFAHHHEVGKSFLPSIVWEVDALFEELCETFDFLKQVSPINEAKARRRFQRNRYEKNPVFYYRPLAFDPAIFKKKLWNIPVHEIEDPALGRLFIEKRDELDTQVTMLQNLDSRAFHYGSLQLYGEVDKNLSKVASKLLDVLPVRTTRKKKRFVDAVEFHKSAMEEVSYYNKIYKGFNAEVIINEDMYSGLMVSQSTLNIGKEFNIPAYRVAPLLQHEIGTHLVTYFNGLSQPFQQLHNGFAGYEELQEGLAVLAEYLVGGLSSSRLRLLAARVKAAESMISGADFVQTFKILINKYGFSRSAAFTVTMRIYRGGGLTKDIIYLRGLLELLEYLKNGGKLEPLYVGKISYAHIPLVNELSIRGILKKEPLMPRFLNDNVVKVKLKKLRKDFSLIDFAKKEAVLIK